VAIRVSAMNDREGRERPSRTVDCQTLYVSCEGVMGGDLMTLDWVHKVLTSPTHISRRTTGDANMTKKNYDRQHGERRRGRYGHCVWWWSVGWWTRCVCWWLCWRPWFDLAWLGRVRSSASRGNVPLAQPHRNCRRAISNIRPHITPRRGNCL
jgi:hypothetical protein